MNIIDKIDHILGLKENICISYKGIELTEIDYEEGEVYLGEDDEPISFETMETINEDDFLVYSLTEIDFPEDIFELAQLFKKMINEIETEKESHILFLDSLAIYSKITLQECTKVCNLFLGWENMRLASKEVKKGYLKQLK